MNNKIERIYRILFFLAIIAAVIFFVTKCGNTKEKSEERISHKMMLTQIQHMGSLQVVKYTIQDIVEHEKVRTWLPNSKTILSVTGEVTGCIDLTKLQENDIVTIGDSVSITLPDPEICNVKIDHSRSKVYDIQFGFWEDAKLIDAAYTHAESRITEEAYKMGITADCEDAANKVLKPILNALGFNKVSIRFKTKNAQKNSSDNNALKMLE